jgi:hypothetical protein
MYACRVTDSIVLVGCTSGDLYRSEDSGETWDLIDMSAIGSTIWQMIAKNEETVYGVVDSGKLIISYDAGKTWELLYTLSPAGSPNYPRALYLWPSGELWWVNTNVAYDSKILYSLDGGITWDVLIDLTSIGYDADASMCSISRISGKSVAIGGVSAENDVLIFYDNTYDEVEFAGAPNVGTVNEGFGGFGFGWS